MAKGFVDLGKPLSGSPTKPEKNKLYYPTFNVRGTKLGLSTGQVRFEAVGEVVSVSKRDDSQEIEVHSIRVLSGDGAEGGLGAALDKIATKKTDPMMGKKKGMMAMDKEDAADEMSMDEEMD